MKIRMIGCGGIGSWLYPILLRTCKLDITLQDGDTLEERNLDRQLFDESHIGMNKAEALVQKYGAGTAIPSYLGTSESMQDTMLLVCADNHTARRIALESVDSHPSNACIIGANEYFDASAHLYLPSFKNTDRDYRKMFPEVMSDKTEDRTGGCQVKMKVYPQLCLANATAAVFMGKILFLYMQCLELADGDDKNIVFFSLPKEIISQRYSLSQKGIM